MCWDKIRREKQRRHLDSRRKQKEAEAKKPEDELRLEYRRVMIKYVLDILASNSGKIIPLLGAIIIFAVDWLGDKFRR
jgi:hypothetical protein